MRSPIVDVIINLCSRITPRERVALALTLLSTEAALNEGNPNLQDFTPTGDAFEDAIAFLRAVRVDSVKVEL